MRIALKTLAILGLGAIALGAASCGGGDDGGNLTTSVTRERAGVRLTVTLDKGRYDTDDTVKITAVAQNITGESLTYGFGPQGSPPLRLALTTALAGEQLLNPSDAETPEPGQTLSPGNKVTTESRWDQQLATYVTAVAAPAGRYVATAKINIAAAGAQEVIAVTAAIEFELRGGDPIILQDEVIELALSSDEVQEWFAVRSPVVVCAVSGSNLYYRGSSVTGEVTNVPVNAYDSQLESGFPICSPVTAEDEWRVIFFSANGPDPVRISAYFDLNDGEFRRVEAEEVGGASG